MNHSYIYLLYYKHGNKTGKVFSSIHFFTKMLRGFSLTDFLESIAHFWNQKSTNNTTKYLLFRGNFISKFDTMSKVSWKDITFCQIVPKWTYVNKLLIYYLCTRIKLTIEEIFNRDSNKIHVKVYKRKNHIYWYW